jgi:DNA-3-methyladenine glycosylase I
MSLSDGLRRHDDGVIRCAWCTDDATYRAYHDDEWGMPVLDETRLFEKLCLEGFQSGLSWLTILRKRENFRRAFAGFDVHAIAGFGDRDVKRLLADAGIVRHRGKIESTINNAKRVLEHFPNKGQFAAFVWSFETEASTLRRTWAEMKAMTTNDNAKRFSKELKTMGFSFVGPTTAYAFMQAMGLVDDHVRGCPAGDVARNARRTLMRKG